MNKRSFICSNFEELYIVCKVLMTLQLNNFTIKKTFDMFEVGM